MLELVKGIEGIIWELIVYFFPTNFSPNYQCCWLHKNPETHFKKKNKRKSEVKASYSTTSMQSLLLTHIPAWYKMHGALQLPQAMFGPKYFCHSPVSTLFLSSLYPIFFTPLPYKHEGAEGLQLHSLKNKAKDGGQRSRFCMALL